MAFAALSWQWKLAIVYLGVLVFCTAFVWWAAKYAPLEEDL